MSKLSWNIIEEVKLTLSSGRVRNSYIIECTCGFARKIHVSEWNKLLTGTQKSNIGSMCRTCKLSSKTVQEKTMIAFKNLYNNLKSSCKRMNRELSISLHQACELYQSNCFYCNRAPSNIYKINSKYMNFEQAYNGIDRTDSKLGYIKGNVVACCDRCNTAKNDMSLEEYYKFINDNYSFRVHRLEREFVEPSGSKLEASL